MVAAVGFVFGVGGWIIGSGGLKSAGSAAVKECREEGIIFHGVPSDVWLEDKPGPKGSCWCGKADG